jgi:succinylglutamate desuccinylase
MNKVSQQSVAVSERIIGTYTKGRQGKLLIILGGIHGNEGSGVVAIESVIRDLEANQPAFRGKVVGIRGNVRALAEKQRFIDKDLNRNWTPERVDYLRETPLELLQGNEDREAAELIRVIEEISYEQEYDQRVFIDLHATSAGGGGFSIIHESESNRFLASLVQLPVIYGLEKKLNNTLSDYLCGHGYHGLNYEGGKIGSAETIEVHSAGLWLMLAGIGCLHPKDVPSYREQVDCILNASKDLPKAVKAIYRHHIDPEDDFHMDPGYKNFQQVKQGDILGRDRIGKVEAPFDAMLLMPLYQKQGEDGFFLVQETEF